MSVPESTYPRVTAKSGRFTTRLLGIAALACVSISAARSSTGLRPVEFAEGSNTWTLQVRVENDEVQSLALSRELLAQGLKIETGPIPVSFLPGRTKNIVIALDPERLRKLPDGLYTEVIRAAAVLPSESDQPVFTTKLVHLRVASGRLERLSLSEYSALADPWREESLADGRIVFVQPGTHLTEKTVDTQQRPDVLIPTIEFLSTQVATDETVDD